MLKKVIIAGGGTGGHIYPAIAIGRGLKNRFPDAEILFVGTERGLENDLVPKAGFTLKKIRAKGFKRKLTLDNLITIKEVIMGGIESLILLKKEKPDLVIGTGGYVAGPVVFFAALFNIPTFIHEQNVKPGVTNRILSRFVDKIAVSFSDSIKYFPQEKVVVTGNPIRPEIVSADRMKALKELDLDPEKPVILSFGGSQGARRINEAMMDLIERIGDESSFQLFHITGQKNYEEFIQKLENKGINPRTLGNIKIRPYVYDMHNAIAAADLVISRAGAITIAELTAAGKPAILVPLPTAADRHQDYNANLMKKNGAAVVVKDWDLSGEKLHSIIRDLVFDRERLQKMSAASKSLGKPDALDRILDEIILLLN
ncbi:undecaprenyldiphospho-muramoylpentapeptide beta-N-acetylglucosaminyltransferase [Thermosediminibacter oceani]|uniref:UDP-N-acetylglucosamine--N-acetylmuramyl-(pentapeptide) pyrophosphoryl-undecaprenol N-acetylglucosamine transferase n=1 Tax=Thermosediminibacter oceani (strain ATCC BAA-1034 / DSM 16646 / JW/IW-1228P) TaxID=555079 RepID=D9S2T7_THEOJ|nr:undecaprenyldiphospho-muramoylpentapeptide beta-N-acetylglucosaminyltransferase [Thermosediminibacter oceani]ADL07714.1 UDP-N-acetylglucosamine--N-acetylmuramyl-(pentapeptide) pyrophosphoryl-undecaprenol N-acetylglucosamine transferase [Thermosediminibacter oceani DSM 16646]